jgi:hypothetical protein
MAQTEAQRKSRQRAKRKEEKKKEVRDCHVSEKNHDQVKRELKKRIIEIDGD